MAAEIRSSLRHQWLQSVLGEGADVRLLAGDASFRRYFRVSHAGNDYVLMDAPPPHEDVRPFIQVRDWLEQAGLRVSAVHAADAELGFLLLEDFGDITWAVHLSAGGDADPMFADALRQLRLLQDSQPGFELHPFDMARMRRECDLYLDWYLPQVAGLTPDAGQRQGFHAALTDALQEIEALPRVPVHLDYHSRNLMLPAGSLPLGQIDYQDAVAGPVTYDLASLLYDCYQDYPESVRLQWSRCFYQALPDQLAAAFDDFDEWHHKLRLTAMQRHIKAIGIFARLAYRDGKRQFLGEIPLTRKHLLEELAALGIDKNECPLLFRAPQPHGL
ncbi:aminoglycoside phosphotransferase family protein [Mariprofundus ferrooxydans]|uniref:aminoglycoside phosphotransferase family protein n=1 Tax=Mariprofundus ferrooxydans TaxID=314344 RepID=UPI0003687E90|nr:phosphotransferase [Mariprofundus ferrooxydans]